jgi:quinol-cytochrome oxidoreductase complex cytochrome b subunit
MELQGHSDEHKDESDQEVPFFPNVLLAEVSLAVAVIGLLAIFVSLFPLELSEKFDPLNPPSVLEPEWYFMGVYQLLKTQSVEPLHGILLMTGLGIFLVLVPFLDRGSERRPMRRPLFTAFALFAIVQFLALTTYGYLSPGRVGTFADSRFTTAVVLTNLIAFGLGALVVLVNRRIAGGAKP